MKYVYAALLEPGATEGWYIVSFPDLPGCYSQGTDLAHALTMAQSGLKQWVEYHKDKNIPLPVATDIKSLTADGDGFFTYITADVKDSRAVKRTVSLPQWLDENASEAGLSLSRVLQDALAEKLSS